MKRKLTVKNVMTKQCCHDRFRVYHQLCLALTTGKKVTSTPEIHIPYGFKHAKSMFTVTLHIASMS